MPLACALALALAVATGAAAQERPLPAPGPDAWRPLAFPKIERHTRYEVVREDGQAVLRAEAECSASGLLLPLAGVDLAATPVLRWRWRVDEPLPPGDERSRDGDDFAARVYLAFAFEPEHAGLLERAARRLAKALYGETLPGHTLNYVWSHTAPLGAHWPNPFADASHMIVAAQGGAPGWREAEADVLADHARICGRPAPAPLFVALMTDADNRCARARASYADFRLAPRR